MLCQRVREEREEGPAAKCSAVWKHFARGQCQLRQVALAMALERLVRCRPGARIVYGVYHHKRRDMGEDLCTLFGHDLGLPSRARAGAPRPSGVAQTMVLGHVIAPPRYLELVFPETLEVDRGMGSA